MTRESVRIKRSFILWQTIILLGLFLAFIVSIAKGYIVKVREESKDRMNRAANATVDYIVRQEDIPASVTDPYVFFIIDEKDGSYVIDRQDTSEEARILWAQYRTKLTYQMQRQKRGWISYPTLGVWDFLESSKMIRYFVVEDRGWIVIFEDALPSDWELFQNIFNKKNYVDLIIVVILGFILFKMITDRFFEKNEKNIKDFYAGSILDFNPAASRKTSPTAGLQETVKRKPLDVYFDEASKVEEKKSKDISANDNSVKHSDPEFKINMGKNISQSIAPEIKSQVPTSLRVEKKKVLKEQHEEAKGEGPLSGDSENSLQNWTVSAKGIKSPVLKKMLKELREQREKV